MFVYKKIDYLNAIFKLAMYSFGILIAICVCAISFIWRTLNKERESEENNENIIIAFIGRKFSGKDSVANVWKKFVNRVTNFAIPLKDDCIKKYDVYM